MSRTSFHDSTIEKEIRYDRASGDYACYVAGQYIGSRANHHEAENLCNEVAYDLINSGACYTATQLDGGNDPIEVEVWESCGEKLTDFKVGEGLTELTVCVCGADKPGIELVIGGLCINESIEQVITLADLRKLCTNLLAIVQDARLVAVVA